MLNITNLDKLKIKRITECKIYFNYDGKSYFAKDVDEYEDYVLTLFKRNIENNKMTMTELATSPYCSLHEILGDILFKAYPFEKGNLVYKFIDKEKFVEILQSYKLVEYNKQQ